MPSLGIDAPVVASAIDVKQGVLGVPADIHKTGWWSDSATPVDATGTVLIAGHVDSAAAGAGAFFPLKQARRGTLIEVTTASGQTKTYKIASVQTMLKEDLPTRIWSQNGPNRLVVVTCGGPFDHGDRALPGQRRGHCSPGLARTRTSRARRQTDARRATPKSGSRVSFARLVAGLLIRRGTARPASAAPSASG